MNTLDQRSFCPVMPVSTVRTRPEFCLERSPQGRFANRPYNAFS
jgi:hypothetical protein